MSIGVLDILLSLGLGLGDVAAGGVFVAVDVAADEVDGTSAEGVLWVTAAFPFFPPFPRDSRPFVAGFFFWGRISGIGGVSDIGGIGGLNFLRPLHQLSSFWRADNGEMANLLTIPAARPSALYYHHHLPIPEV